MHWISTKEASPETLELVLIFDESEGQFVGHLDQSKKYWQMYGTNSQHFNVTHWMPLPPNPPKTSERLLDDFKKELHNAVVGSTIKVTNVVPEMVVDKLVREKARALKCGVKFEKISQEYIIGFVEE
ncbi:DUF551 domain-containing protein [Mucilaginibacter sp. HC2]|uniref:DUF551 domain-containing protein n=1 Tax=Mucilaginibacter inviolabilis TaxID=2714892 RepID=UPI00140A6152|nr:DUF551 domain-containing protein [Mucilaginibacter inviolabilis]NHA06976.1 DUF551 domain-containing protein [Mucilaginibacter inviolabilis]